MAALPIALRELVVTSSRRESPRKPFPRLVPVAGWRHERKLSQLARRWDERQLSQLSGRWNHVGYRETGNRRWLWISIRRAGAESQCAEAQRTGDHGCRHGLLRIHRELLLRLLHLVRERRAVCALLLCALLRALSPAWGGKFRCTHAQRAPDPTARSRSVEGRYGLRLRFKPCGSFPLVACPAEYGIRQPVSPRERVAGASRFGGMQ